MNKKINVSRDLESRARIAAQSPVRIPEPAVPAPAEIEEPQKESNDAQSTEEVRPQADQSPAPAEKPKKTGRPAKRNP